MSPNRLLAAVALLVVPLAGCAASQHDATSREHATPYVANANVGAVKVRGLEIVPTQLPASPATVASTPPVTSGGVTSPGATPSPNALGSAQAFLAMTLLSTQTDELVGASVPGGQVSLINSSGPLTVQPHSLLLINAPNSTTSTQPALAITGLPSVPAYGTSLRVTLIFRTAGSVTVDTPVRTATGL